jgi:hypothetical protein
MHCTVTQIFSYKLISQDQAKVITKAHATKKADLIAITVAEDLSESDCASASLFARSSAMSLFGTSSPPLGLGAGATSPFLSTS